VGVDQVGGDARPGRGGVVGAVGDGHAVRVAVVGADEHLLGQAGGIRAVAPGHVGHDLLKGRAVVDALVGAVEVSWPRGAAGAHGGIGTGGMLLRKSFDVV